MDSGDDDAGPSHRSCPSERLSRLSRRTMAADLVATSNDGAADPVQQQHQSRDQSNRSKLNNEEAATATAAAEPNMIGHTAEQGGPAHHVDGPKEVMLGSDQGMEQTQDQSAAEAASEEPAIPAEISAQIILPRLADRSAVTAPSDAIGDALAAYNILRAFSWQIRLSPFAFEELCAALFNPNPSPLMDELHMCVIRTLAFDENKAERAQRGLDLGALDAMSWPEYVWEYLYMHEDDLRNHRWAQPAGSEITNKQLKQGRASSPHTESAFRHSLSDQGAKTSIATTGRSPTRAQRAAALGPAASGPAPPSSPIRAVSGGLGAEEAGRRAVASNLEGCEGALSLRAMMQRPPFRQRPHVEYYAMPPGVKAAILLSLVNDLLDISSVRHEIDKREAAGQWVAGRGGAGGSFPMRSEEERVRRANADSDAEGNADGDDDSEEEGRTRGQAAAAAAAAEFEEDGNTDLCVLCGLGGSLLCCDGCPAAYHMRCIGESAKSIPPGEWLCPECSVGGRGETAGLRVPRAGLNQHKQPHWVCHGCLFRSIKPAPEHIGNEALEEGPMPMDQWSGEAAAVEAKTLRKVKGDEKVHPTSIHAITEPPPVKLLPSLSAEGYVNRYRNSWTAAVAATKTFVEDMSRKRGRPPAGGRVSIPMADLPVPVPLSRFQWPSSAGKGQRGNLVRCGQCHMCRNPLMKKPCLHPIVPRGLDGLDEGTSAPKLMTLTNYAMKLEREVWGVLEGPWGGDTWMGWRRDWAQKVRTATTPEPVARCILELESFLRAAALSPTWGSQAQPCPAGALPRKASAGRKAAPKPAKAPVIASASKSGRLNRASSSGSAAPSTSKRRNYKEDSDSGLSESDGEDQQELYSVDDDPTVVDNPGQSNKSYWVLNQRDKWLGHFKGSTRLPQDAAKHLGRRGGTIRLPGVKYNTKNLVLQPRLAWRGAMQGAHTASQLALQLRKLDSHIQWEALKRPALDADSPLGSAEILQRRPADAPNKGWDYLIQMASAETSTAVGLGPISGDRQPLQPMTAVFGAQQPHQQQQQQQLMSKQVLPQLPGESLAPLQRLQEAEQRQQQSAQIPNQAPSVLPNHVAVQQHQQAFGAREDKQIAVQQAANTLSDAELPRQLPAIAESASRPSESAMPDQAQADSSIPNGLPPDPSAGLDETVGAIRRDARGAKQPPQLGIVPSQTQTAAHLDPLPAAVPGSGASIGDLNQHGAQTGVPDAKLSQQTEAQVKPEASAAPSSLSPSAPHPTPAPTPFLAQQPPQQANSLLSLVPNKEHRPSLAASSAHATGQFGRAQGQGAAAGPSREGTPALKGAPTWLHESQLPLWLVKTFEEKRRRDVAMVAARAAQQAQRDANAASRGLVHLLHPWRNESSGTLTASGLRTKRQEAKAAADAAAAAAADACAICDKVYGEDAEKDESWIACDRCNRWYHGTCVGMTQEMVDENQDKKWECPECGSMRAERRNLAAQRARLKRSSQGKAIASAASGSDGGLDDQPAMSKRDAKKSRRPKAAPKSGKKRKMMEGGEATDETEEAEAVELFCLCRQPDDGREFIECDACNQWFHCECVGVNLQEMSEGDKYTCPLCVRALQQQERREQRKAEAAAAAEIEREAREAQAARKAKLAALDMSSWPRNWQAAVVRVLETVTKLPEALPFAEPVPMEEVPGYREQIPNPMDLGTVLGRAKADAYDTPLETLDDVRQVWQNCRVFNAEGSAIWAVCQQAENSFESNWTSARLPLTPRPPLPPSLAPKKQAKSGNKRQRDAGNPSSSAPSRSEMAATADPGGGAIGSKPRLVVKLSKRQQQPEEEEEPSSSEAEISDSDDEAGQKPRVKLKIKGRSSKQSAGTHDSAADLSRAQKVVRGVLKLKAAAPFSRPVNEEEVPGYGSAVQNPMDLGTVLEKLKNGEYTSLGEVLGDVDLIWSNCRGFNEADSDICDLADQAQQALRMRWQQEGLPTVAPLPPSARKKQKKDGKKSVLETGPSASDPERHSGPKKKKSRAEAAPATDASSAADLSSAQKAVKGTLKLKVAAPFSSPVSEEDVPGYSSVIQNPMDLGSIAEKLKNGEYATTGAVYQDVQLVWDNCRGFNKPDSDICNTCDEAHQAFLAKWQQHGLSLPAADKKKKGRQSGSAKAEAEAAAAGKGGKQPDGKADKMAKQREPSVSDKRRLGAQEAAAAGKPSVKRKRGQDSPGVEEEQSSSSAAAQPKKKSKGAVVKEDVAPEKMSASARLRKGLPPTPPSRISPRMATVEAGSNAAPMAAESGPNEASKGNPKEKPNPAAVHQGVNKAKADPDPPVSRRSSGRLK